MALPPNADNIVSFANTICRIGKNMRDKDFFAGKSFFEGKERKKVTALRNANAKLKASSCKSFSFSQKFQINFHFFA